MSRPLDGLASIKVKLGVLVVLSIIATVVVSQIGARADVPGWITLPVTVVVALAVTQWLATGMTSPLREMTAAATVMATGDHSRRITATSADEVGELARAFNTMAADLAAADAQRREIVATVSHELRTPLTAQQAILENLVDGVAAPAPETLRAALAQSERLSALVSDLLDLSRLDGGAVRLRTAPLDVEALVAQAVAEATSGGAGARGVTVETDIDPALGTTSTPEADPARLAQVLANLLDNAVRHSPAGGVVRVACRTLDADRWEIRVSDQGPGIPADRAERVFDRFGSWDGSGGGTGLGLAIASWACELHGGSIAVVRPGSPDDADPDVAPGATIRAVLPRHPHPTPVPTIHEESTVTSVPAPTPPARVPPTRPPGAPVPQGTDGAVAPAPAPISPVDSVFGDLWPERATRPVPRLVLGSVGIGLFGALALPDRRLGLAAFLILLLSGLLVWSTSARRKEPWTLLSAGLALALGLLVVLRAAEWLGVLAVLVAGLLTTTALIGAHTLAQVVAGPVAWVLSGLRGLPLLRRTLSAMSRVSSMWAIVRTVVLSLLALVVFGGLFASGDAIFGSWASAVVPHVAIDSLVLRVFLTILVGGLVLAACYLSLNPPATEKIAAPPARPVAHRWEWLVPVGIVIVLFVAFLIAQGAAVWGGHDYVERTTGLTYAEYVHQGFGQLTVATVLVLLTIGLTVRKVRRDGPDGLLLRVMLGALAVLALVVVASALHRLDLYQQAYGFTVLRLLVGVFELWLGVVLLFVLGAVASLSWRWLPRAALVAGAIALLVLGAMNAEGWVATQNIERYQATGRLDATYLKTLGPDAAGAIHTLDPTLVACLTSDSVGNDTDDLLSWNLGRARARAVTSADGALDRTGCGGLVNSLDRNSVG